MLHAYIDESGDEGTSERSSSWLVLGCLIIQGRDEAGARAYLHDGIAKIWKGQKVPTHVHFNKVPHVQRKALLNLITGLNFTSCVVALRKSALSPTTLDGLRCPRMYNYIAKHLLERLSWFGADNFQQMHLTIASRAESSWTEFEEYVELLRTRTDHYIKFPQIHSMRNTPAAKDVLVQGADWITSAVACGLNTDPFGEIESCYAEILWGKFWVRRGKLWPYGIKVLPTDHERKNEKLFRKIDAWLEDPTSIIR